ncbi:MAG: PAS domain S-box protein [Bacteroidales bacterium]|nr:PAS domain S-box protein [Bacteroidales bacterium]MCF8455194.1 PAS domain S-box protein [Bacteroidales bacterium]
MEFDLKFYENILDNIQDGIWVSNSDDIIIYANEGMAGIAGIPVSEIVGKNVMVDFSPKTISEFKRFYSKAKQTCLPVWYEVNVTTPAGKYTWQNGWIIPQLVDGKIAQIVTTISDVTERKLAEENFSKSEKENAFLANTALDLVNCKNLNEIYKYVAEQLYLLIDKEGIIIIAEFDNRNNYWQVMAFEGVNRHLDKITKLVGFDLKNLKGNVKTKYYDNIKNGKLTRLTADLSELTEGRISKSVLPVLQKMILIKELYCITFRQKENIFGNVTFITNPKTPMLNANLIEAFISQVSLIIEKIRAEITLNESQQKLKDIVEYSTNMFYQHDTNHILTYVSPQVEDILGYTQEEALMNWTNFVTEHPINETGFQFTVKAIETGMAQPPYELELQNKSGRKIWVEVREAPIVENGKTVAIVGALVDITQRKKAIEALEKSEMNYRLLVNDMYEGLMQTDLYDRIQFVNPRLCQMLGYSEEELIGKIGYETIIFNEDIDKIKAKNDERATHKTDRYIIRLKRKDGDFIWTQISRSLLYNEAGEVVSTVGLITDITQLIEIEEELKKNKDQLQGLFNHMNSAFAYHEILTDEDGKPIDYKFIEVNSAFEYMTGLKREDVIGQKVNTIIPGTENDPADWIGKYGKVALTGKSIAFESYSEGLGKWFHISAYSPEKGYFATTFEDITERKQVEVELENHRNNLETLVKERTAEIEAQNKELEHFNQLFVGREFRIKELRDKVKELEKKINNQ